MKQFITGLIFVLILCLFPFGNEQGYAAQETTDGCVGMKAEYSSLEQGSIVKINIYSNKEYMGELDAEFEYDKSIFEQVTVDDIHTATNYESGQKLHFYGVGFTGIRAISVLGSTMFNRSFFLLPKDHPDDCTHVPNIQKQALPHTQSKLNK